jgi:hypothetical protein
MTIKNVTIFDQAEGTKHSWGWIVANALGKNLDAFTWIFTTL